VGELVCQEGAHSNTHLRYTPAPQRSLSGGDAGGPAQPVQCAGRQVYPVGVAGTAAATAIEAGHPACPPGNRGGMGGGIGGLPPVRADAVGVGPVSISVSLKLEALADHLCGQAGRPDHG